MYEAGKTPDVSDSFWRYFKYVFPEFWSIPIRSSVWNEKPGSELQSEGEVGSRGKAPHQACQRIPWFGPPLRLPLVPPQPRTLGRMQERLPPKFPPPASGKQKPRRLAVVQRDSFPNTSADSPKPYR